MNHWMGLKIHLDMNTRKSYLGEVADEEWEFVALYST